MNRVEDPDSFLRKPLSQLPDDVLNGALLGGDGYPHGPKEKYVHP